MAPQRRRGGAGRWFGSRLGRGLVPGGRGFFNRPRIPGTRHRMGGHGGHGGGGAGHLLLLPLHLAVLALGMLARLLKHKAKRARGRRGVGRHQRAHHKRVHIQRPRISRHHKPHHAAQGRQTHASVAKRKARGYVTGVFNVANRHLKRTRLL